MVLRREGIHLSEESAGEGSRRGFRVYRGASSARSSVDRWWIDLERVADRQVLQDRC